MKSTSRSPRRKARKPVNSRALVSRTVADKKFKRVQLDPRVYPEVANDNFPNYPGMAVWYCEEVVAGRVPACHLEVLACKRFLEMRKISLTAIGAYYWSDAHVIDVCSFIEKLPHVKAFEGDIVLEPVQCFFLAGIFAFRERGTDLRWVRSASLWIPRKNAKALALDTPISTPNGWTTMGEIRVGDEVIAADGTVTKVVAESPVYHDHTCYLVRFSNGEEIVADAGHRWLTTARVDKVGIGVGQGRNKSGSNLTRVRTTQEIYETQTYGKRQDRNHSIAMPEPMTGEEKDLPVDPYLLGAWLGDGNSEDPRIFVSEGDLDEMKANLETCGVEVDTRRDRTCWTMILRPSGTKDQTFSVDGRKRTIKRDLAALGVIGNKHIPSVYLRASRDQRLALLQGLLDTDGTINKNGANIVFTTTCEALKEGVCELLASFGVKFSARTEQDICNGRTLNSTHWNIQFYTTRDRLPVFRLKRKLDRMRDSNGARERSRSVQIVSVEPVPSVPVKCIAVDHPSHLFLAGRTMIPTHNTTLSTGILLFCLLCEGEIGAEATISAGSEKQAGIPYNAIRDTFKLLPELKDEYGIKDTADYTEFKKVGAKITLATAKAENLDGYNPHVVLAEELHAQSQNVIGVLKTAMGSRRAPLFLTISTAGRDVNAAAYDDWTMNQAVLEGRMQADRLFCVMYAATPEDAEKKFDLSVIEKVNPLWGVSLNPTSIDEEIIEALKSPSKLNEYLRTRLNVWSRAAGNLIAKEDWDACEDIELALEAFKGFPIYVGVDLASRNDLNAVAFLVQVGGTVYTVGKYWLGRNCPRMKDDRFADSFAKWAEDRWLELTDLHDGTFVDYKAVLRVILEMLDGHTVKGVALDDYQANLLASEIELAGYPTFIVSKNAKSLTPSTEDLIARVGNPQLFQHDGNPITAWCAGNVVGYWDSNDNVLPKKEKKGSKANIDGIDAIILANAIRIDDEAGVLGIDQKDREKPNPYLQRGLAGFAA